MDAGDLKADMRACFDFGAASAEAKAKLRAGQCYRVILEAEPKNGYRSWRSVLFRVLALGRKDDRGFCHFIEVTEAPKAPSEGLPDFSIVRRLCECTLFSDELGQFAIGDGCSPVSPEVFDAALRAAVACASAHLEGASAPAT